MFIWRLQTLFSHHNLVFSFSNVDNFSFNIVSNTVSCFLFNNRFAFFS